MAQIPRQLPGDARNVHRRMDDAEFYLVDIPHGTLPQTPVGMIENTEEWREWRLLNIELIHARQTLNVQLAPPHNTPDNFRLARDFWWRVATQHEHARNAHAFAYHGIRRADSESAEGIAELVQNILLRIRAVEQRAAARNVTTAPQEASIQSGYPAPAQPQSNGPSRSSNSPNTIQAQANAAQPHDMRPALSAVNAYNANPLQYQSIAPHPGPERYPLTIRIRSTDNKGSQSQRPPFSQPRHAVFLYLGRDLSGNVLLPRLSDGRNMFARSEKDQTDRGWGPGVVVHADVRAEVGIADAVQTSGLIGRDKGPPPLP